jgi:dephospho-CoA kinase
VVRVLLTGMSGVGKTSVVQALGDRGHRAVDTDDGWCELLPDGRQRWREDAVRDLLATTDGELFFLAGCEENMVAFLSEFDHVVLLSAPVETVRDRLRTRTNNPYGKSPDELARVLADLRDVEPRLRTIATAEVVTTAPLDAVVDQVLAIVAGTPPAPAAQSGPGPEA